MESSDLGGIMCEKLALSVDDTAERLSLSRNAVNDLIRARQLRSVKIGRRRLVPVDAIHELLADLSDADAHSASSA